MSRGCWPIRSELPGGRGALRSLRGNQVPGESRPGEGRVASREAGGEGRAGKHGGVGVAVGDSRGTAAV